MFLSNQPDAIVLYSLILLSSHERCVEKAGKVLFRAIVNAVTSIW